MRGCWHEPGAFTSTGGVLRGCDEQIGVEASQAEPLRLLQQCVAILGQQDCGTAALQTGFDGIDEELTRAKQSAEQAVVGCGACGVVFVGNVAVGLLSRDVGRLCCGRSWLSARSHDAESGAGLLARRGGRVCVVASHANNVLRSAKGSSKVDARSAMCKGAQALQTMQTEHGCLTAAERERLIVLLSAW